MLAQRDLDLHSRIGIVPEDFDDFGERFAMRRRLLDQLGDDNLSGLRIAARIRWHENVLTDALVLGDQIPNAALLINAAHNFAVRALEYIDNHAFGSAPSVDADLAARHTVAVKRLVHLLR